MDIEHGSFIPVSNSDSLDFQGGKSQKLKDLWWTNVNFSVGKKKILDNCWGEIKPGQLSGIMGPSGSGKSSLLNVLAGRSSSTSNILVEGKIKVGGRSINPISYRKNIAYVMQEDYLLATQTPREALTFSANLRLPSHLTRDQIDQKVESLLKSLGLKDCADVMIGGELVKGISGGQKKRTSVGIELVTDPTLLFLDEPTTGLDSYSAHVLLKLLKRLASKCAILLTIHQPSSQLFYLLDNVIFMKEGRIVYQGAINEILYFYTSKGYLYPENYNPSDFIMEICQSESMKTLEEKGLIMAVPERFTANSSPASKVKIFPQLSNFSISFDLEETPSDSSSITSTDQFKIDEKDLKFTAESSFARQLYYLLHRECVKTLRDKKVLAARIVFTTIVNALAGLIFYQIGFRDYADPNTFNSHLGAIMLLMLFALIASAQAAMLTLPLERPMMLREYVTGTYSVSSYFLSKTIVDMPIIFLQMLYAYCISYFLIGLQGKFFYLVCISWALGMVSCSMATALGCLIPDAKRVSEFSPLMFLPQMLFAGFLIRTTQIPSVVRWAQYLCALKYAMNLAIMTEFQTSGESCSENKFTKMACENLIAVNDVRPENYLMYIIAFVILIVGFRLIGGIGLYYRAKRFF